MNGKHTDTVPPGYTADLIRAIEHLAFQYRLDGNVSDTLKQAADELQRLRDVLEKIGGNRSGSWQLLAEMARDAVS